MSEYMCDKCGYVSELMMWPSKLVFWGNQEEPSEYECYCPECGADSNHMEEVEQDDED